MTGFLLPYKQTNFAGARANGLSPCWLFDYAQGKYAVSEGLEAKQGTPVGSVTDSVYGPAIRLAAGGNVNRVDVSGPPDVLWPNTNSITLIIRFRIDQPPSGDNIIWGTEVVDTQSFLAGGGTVFFDWAGTGGDRRISYAAGLDPAFWATWRTWIYSAGPLGLRLACDGEIKASNGNEAYLQTSVRNRYSLGYRSAGFHMLYDWDVALFGVFCEQLPDDDIRYLSLEDNAHELFTPEWQTWMPIGVGTAGPGPGETGAVDDSAAFSDVIAGAFSGIGMVMDTASVADVVSGQGAFLGPVNDSFNAFDSFVGSTAVGVVVNDVAHYTDTLDVRASYISDETDNVSLIDEFIGDTSKKIGVIDDSLTLADAHGAQGAYVGAFSEMIMFSDLIREPMEPGVGEDIERTIQDVVADNVQEVS